MRLLHTSTFALQEINPRAIPPYAILSHVWGEEEITFRDMQSGAAENKAGYEKIKGACSVAAACELDYVWIDTCCIDKTSSAELSEAINSMYQWYHEAEVCYVYLADVPFNIDHDPAGDRQAADPHFSASRWFTRGWTLQELISPPTVIFLDKEWHIFGTKYSLQTAISSITGIPTNVLLGADVGTATIAQRMSWASKRETTRVEDIAYCLMGIFDIHMPLLYGEGDRAFIRLQEEIMRTSNDSSLFAWNSDSENHDGFLAASPAAFARSWNIVKLPRFHFLGSSPGPFTVSSKGIHFSTQFVEIGSGLGLAVLDCTKEGREKMCVAVRIRYTAVTKTDFVRDPGAELELLDAETVRSAPRINLCVRKKASVPKATSSRQGDAARFAAIMEARRPAKPAASPSERQQPTSPVPNNATASGLADPSYDGGAQGEGGAGTKHVRKYPATFQCTLCPSRFTRAYNLRSHLRTHSDERPFKCTVCGTAFARQHDRKRHQALHSREDVRP